MDTSFTQPPSTATRHQLAKLRADTPGPKSYTQSLTARPITTCSGPNNAFMHSGFPRRSLLPPLPDISPSRTPTRKIPPKVTIPIPASPAYSDATYNTTPGYIGPGQSSARAYPKFTPEEVEMPDVSVADLAMAVAARYPRGATMPAFYGRGVKVPPSLRVRDVRQRGKGQASGGEGGGGSLERKREASHRGDHEV